MVLHPLIIGLLLLAALMHASWHAILKSDHSDRLATFGVIKGIGMAMALCAMPFLPSLEPAAWTYLMVSVPIHLLYFTFLLHAYSYGDLSHTFPIARGISPLLVLLVSGQLTGEQLRPQDVVGVVLMSAGVIALALLQATGRADARRPSWPRHAVRGPDGHHHRCLHRRRRAGRAQRRPDAAALAGLHRLALRPGRALAAPAGDVLAARHGMAASARPLVARRDRRGDRQCQLYQSSELMTRLPIAAG